MNKYQGALEYINKKCKLDQLKFNSMIGNEMVSRIEELVDKETPVKPIVEDARKFGYSYGHSYICPECNKVYVNVKHNYCPNCGQKLDWSECE